MFKRVKGKLILLGVSGSILSSMSAIGQVADKGLRPASNTYRAYQDASISRDSGLYQPLDLLNDFYPSIEVRIEDHDNVRRRPGFQEEDLLIVVNPALGYRTNVGRHQFYAAYNGTFTFHQDLEQEDAESNVVNAKLGLDLTRRWDLELFGSIGDSFEPRGLSGSRSFNDFSGNGFNSGPDTVDFVSYGADLIFGRKIGVVQAVLGYEYIGTDYSSRGLSDDINFSDSRDRNAESVHFDVNWQFSDNTSVFGRIQKTDIDYDRSDSTLDSEQTDILIGLRLKPTNSISGVLGAGVSEKKFDDNRRETFDDTIYYANLNYAFNPFSSISFNASRTVEEPGDVVSDFYQSDFFGVGFSHSFSPRFAIEAYAKTIHDDFNTGREDEFFDWGVELTYAWRDWLTAGVYYGEIERESDVENVAYDDAYFGIRLRSDLRNLLSSGSKRKREPYSFGEPEKSTLSHR